LKFLKEKIFLSLLIITISTNFYSINSYAYSGSDHDCGDFSSYDELIDYWNAMGYSATYDPERLDGFGNKVDDGIPCEAPADYDINKINSIQYSEDITEEDSSLAYETGYVYGGKHDEINFDDDFVAHSMAYKDAFHEGFDKAQEDKEYYEELGYELGEKNKELVIPKGLSKTMEDIFKTAYNDGYDIYMYDKEEKYYRIGYKDGLKLIHRKLDVEENLLEEYNSGFHSAVSKLKRKYKEKGYDAAFNQSEYIDPGYTNEKFTKWYKKGFESNDIAKEINEENKEKENAKSSFDLTPILTIGSIIIVFIIIYLLMHKNPIKRR